eukprot:1165392-Pyramimonas_sp.AAC.1
MKKPWKEPRTASARRPLVRGGAPRFPKRAVMGVPEQRFAATSQPTVSGNNRCWATMCFEFSHGTTRGDNDIGVVPNSPFKP